MKKVITSIGIVLIGISLVKAQSYADPAQVAEIKANLKDIKIVLFSPDGNISIHFDADTENAMLFTNGREVFEDAEGNQYTEANGKWYKMDRTSLNMQMSWMDGGFPIYYRLYPAHAAAHRLVEFSQITSERMEELGHRPLNPANASKSYKVSGALYEFDTEGRLKAMRHPPNASVTFVYEEVDITLPEEYETLKLPGNMIKMFKDAVKNNN